MYAGTILSSTDYNSPEFFDDDGPKGGYRVIEHIGDVACRECLNLFTAGGINKAVAGAKVLFKDDLEEAFGPDVRAVMRAARKWLLQKNIEDWDNIASELRGSFDWSQLSIDKSYQTLLTAFNKLK